MLSFFPRGVLDGVLNLIESVSEGFPSYSSRYESVFVLRNENALQLFLLKFTPQVIVGKYGTSSVSSKLMNR